MVAVSAECIAAWPRFDPRDHHRDHVGELAAAGARHREDFVRITPLPASMRAVKPLWRGARIRISIATCSNSASRGSARAGARPRVEAHPRPATSTLATRHRQLRCGRMRSRRLPRITMHAASARYGLMIGTARDRATQHRVTRDFASAVPAHRLGNDEMMSGMILVHGAVWSAVSLSYRADPRGAGVMAAAAMGQMLIDRGAFPGARRRGGRGAQARGRSRNSVPASASALTRDGTVETCASW